MRSGNLVDEIWLNKENIKKAYIEANRIGIKKINEDLIELLENITFKQNWIECYRNDMINYMKQKNKPNMFFPEKIAKDILEVLKIIDNNEENLKRVLSIKCFGDSKYFEKNIEHILIRIIKLYLLDIDNQEEYTDDDILLNVRNC